MRGSPQLWGDKSAVRFAQTALAELKHHRPGPSTLSC